MILDFYGEKLWHRFMRVLIIFNWEDPDTVWYREEVECIHGRVYCFHLCLPSYKISIRKEHI